MIPLIASYRRNTAQSISSGVATVIDYDVKVMDNYEAVKTGASWKFTAPFTGIYSGSASILFAVNNAFAVGEVLWLYYVLNGEYRTLYRNDQINTSASLNGPNAFGSFNVYLQTNEVLQIFAYQASGSALSLHADGRHNYFSIFGIPSIE